jgi:hypothetical protein
MSVTIRTDTPVVPMEPLRLVWSAMSRVSALTKSGGGNWEFIHRINEE